MTIELPDVMLGSQPLTSEQARIEIACGLYVGGEVSLGQAARIAGVPYIAFMHELTKHNICLNYTMADLEHDFEMAEKLAGKSVAA